MNLLKSLLIKKTAVQSLSTTAVVQLSAKEVTAVAGGRYGRNRPPYHGRQNRS